MLVLTCQAFTTSYFLPDLGINQEEANCFNAAELLTIAESDLNRVEQLYQSITDSIALLDDLSDKCIPKPNPPTLNLLQTDKGKLKKSMSSKVRKLQQFQEKLTEDPLINDLVGSDISTIVTQITSMASTGQNIPCGNLQFSITKVKVL